MKGRKSKILSIIMTVIFLESYVLGTIPAFAGTASSSVTINVTDSSGQTITPYSNTTGGNVDQILGTPIRLAPNANAQLSSNFSGCTVTSRLYKFVTAVSTNVADKPAFPADSAMTPLTVPAPNSAAAYAGDIGAQGYVSLRHYNYAGKSSSTGLSRDQSFGSPVNSTSMIVQRAVVASTDKLSDTPGNPSNSSKDSTYAFLDNNTVYSGSTPSSYAGLKAMKMWGYFVPPTTGNYQLGAYSDDGAYGYIVVNGAQQVFVNDWSIKAAFDRSQNNSIALVKGNYYPIYMEWYEGCATQAAFVPVYKIQNGSSWPSWTNGTSGKVTASEVIPQSCFWASNTTTPGDSATAYFADTSGLAFPAQDGVYYLATKSVTDNAAVAPKGLYGPFVVDNTSPTITSFTVTSDNSTNTLATNNNKLIINFTASEALKAPPAVKVNGYTPNAVLTDNGNNSYSMNITINSNGTLPINTINTQGAVVAGTSPALNNAPIAVQVLDYSDLSGNTGIPATNSNVTFDNIAPTVALSYSATPISTGTETITATYSEPVKTGETPIIAVTPKGAGGVNNQSMIPSADRKTWTYNYAVNTTNGTDGNATVSLSAVHDQAGNTASNPTNPTFDIETTVPTPVITFSANPVKAGTETITATYNQQIPSDIPKISIDQPGSTDINGASMTPNADKTVWIYTYTVNAASGTVYVDGTAKVSIAPVHNQYNAIASSPSTTAFVIDTTAPTVALSYAAANAKAGTNRITASYNEPVATGQTPQITVKQQGTAIANAAMAPSADRKTWIYDYTVNTADGTNYKDGQATISLSTVTDAAGNSSLAPTNTTFNIDTTPPVLTAGNPSVSKTNNGPVTYCVTVSAGDNVNLKSSQVSLVKTGTADGTVTANGSTITVTGITGTGTLGVVIAAGAAADAAGNQSVAVNTATFQVGGTAPTIVITPQTVAPTNASSLVYEVTYSVNTTPAVTPTITLKAADVTVNTTGTASAGTIQITAVPGDTNSRYVTLTNVTGDGNIGITLAAGTAADDIGTLALGASSTTLLVDNTAPTLSTVSIKSNNANPLYAKVGDVVTLSFTANETLSGTPVVTIAGHSVVVTPQTGNSYTATYTMLSSDSEGVVPYTIAFSDLAGNNGIQVISTTDNTSVTFDRTAPAVVSLNADKTIGKQGDKVTITAVYSEAMKVSPVINIDLTGSDADIIGATMTQGSDNRTWTYTWTIPTGHDGSVAVTTSGNDLAGNQSSNCNPLSLTIDNQSPSVTLSLSKALGKQDDKITITAVFSKDMKSTPAPTINIDAPLSDVDINGASMTMGVDDKTWTYIYTVPAGHDGTVSITTNGFDLAGNPSLTSAPVNFTIDNIAPTLNPVSIVSNNSNSSYAKVGDTITLSFTGSEAISGTPLVKIAGNNATVVAGSGNGFTATYKMKSTDSEGTVQFTIDYSDLAGNAGIRVTGSTDGTSVIFDKTAPTVTIGNPSAGLTNNGPVTYTVTYSGADTITLNSSDVVLQRSGTANGDVTVSGSGNTRTVKIDNITGNGTIKIMINAGTAKDLAGNSSLATAYSNSFTVDNTPPTGNVDYDSAYTTKPVDVTVTTSEGEILTHTFTQNGSYTFNFQDAAGNSGSTTVTVSNIVQLKPNLKTLVIRQNSSKAITISVNRTINNITTSLDLPLYVPAGSYDINYIKEVSKKAGTNRTFTVTATNKIISDMKHGKNNNSYNLRVYLNVNSNEYINIPVQILPYGKN